jgi:glycogen(starch) synthase
VITQHGPGLPEDEVVEGVRVVRVRPDAPGVPDWQPRFIEWCFGFNVAVARAAISLMSSWEPDVVHGHDWLVGQAAVLACEARSVPFVLTVHATEAGRMNGDLSSDQSRAIDATESWSVEHADAVIVCSGAMRDEVAGLFGTDPDEIAVIPNGIDPAEWTAADSARRRVRREFGTPLIVYCGRLEDEKGVQTLIDAIALLRVDRPDLHAAIVGTGSALQRLKTRVRRRHLQDVVTFTGFIPDADMRATVAAADVAVVPSIYEPFGFVALEAMALGAPLVASRTGGLAEIVVDGRTGWLAVPGYAPDLARILDEVLSAPRVAKARAVAARARVAEEYGWDAIADRTDSVYRSVTR